MERSFFISILFIATISVIGCYRVYGFIINPQRILNLDFYSSEGLILNPPYDKGSLQNVEMGQVTLRTAAYPQYVPGQYIKFSGKILHNVIYYPKISELPEKSNRWLLLISMFRVGVINRLRKVLPEPAYSLVLGTILGYKSNWPESYRSAFISSGTTHVIVASGYNVSILIAIWSFFAIRFGYRFYIFGSLILILGFIFMTGIDPPIVRASIMGIINVYALIRGEYKVSLYILVFVALVMLAFNPSFILDIGFQLSFTATFIIILLAPYVNFLRPLASQVMLVVFINLAILPIVSYYFGQVSLFSIVANLLVLWVVPVITVGGILLALFPNVILQVIVIALSDYFFIIQDYFSQFEFAVIQYRLSLVGVVIYYVIFSLVLKFLLRYLNEKSD